MDPSNIRRELDSC